MTEYRQAGKFFPDRSAPLPRVPEYLKGLAAFGFEDAPQARHLLVHADTLEVTVQMNPQVITGIETGQQRLRLKRFNNAAKRDRGTLWRLACSCKERGDKLPRLERRAGILGLVIPGTRFPDPATGRAVNVGGVVHLEGTTSGFVSMFVCPRCAHGYLFTDTQELITSAGTISPIAPPDNDPHLAERGAIQHLLDFSVPETIDWTKLRPSRFVVAALGVGSRRRVTDAQADTPL